MIEMIDVGAVQGVIGAAIAAGCAVIALWSSKQNIFGLGEFLTAVVIGAMIGAAVGGIAAAISGGNILKGVLFGAVGGAVTGALSFGIGSVMSSMTAVGDAGSVAGGGVTATASEGSFIIADAAGTTLGTAEAVVAPGGGVVTAASSGGGGFWAGIGDSLGLAAGEGSAIAGQAGASALSSGIGAVADSYQAERAADRMEDEAQKTRDFTASQAELNRQNAIDLANTRGGYSGSSLRSTDDMIRLEEENRKTIIEGTKAKTEGDIALNEHTYAEQEAARNRVSASGAALSAGAPSKSVSTETVAEVNEASKEPSALDQQEYALA
ncbi:MAG: hypothetical protein DRN30_03085 [Thermoplasmata archaeon]|nr:MAG: hypothetical protein DRN30_03085 [Thermoplasmata archaeon]